MDHGDAGSEESGLELTINIAGETVLRMKENNEHR